MVCIQGADDVLRFISALVAFHLLSSIAPNY